MDADFFASCKRRWAPPVENLLDLEEGLRVGFGCRASANVAGLD